MARKPPTAAATSVPALAPAPSQVEEVLSDRLVTQGLRRLVAERHGGLGGDTGMDREWALFFELRNGTGHGGQTRYVDALALNLWPSKRHRRVAYELKASRSDFLRELDKPEKRQWAVDISDEFWYVCAAGVAKETEVPQGCGLLVADEALSKLRKVRPALQREARELTLTELAAFARKTGERQGLLFRYSGKELDEAALEALLEARMDEFLTAKVAARVERDYRNRLATATNLLNKYARDMRSVGIEPPVWMEQGLGTAADLWDASEWAKSAFITGPGLEPLLESRQTIKRALHQLENAQRHVAQVAEAVNKLLPALPPAPAPKSADDDLEGL